MLPLLERLEVDPGECCCCCCELGDEEAAAAAVADAVSDDGGWAAAGDPPLLTGSCIVAAGAAVSAAFLGSESPLAVELAASASRRSSSSACLVFTSVMTFSMLEAPPAPSGTTEGAFDEREVSAAESFLTVLMGSLSCYTHYQRTVSLCCCSS